MMQAERWARVESGAIAQRRTFTVWTETDADGSDVLLGRPDPNPRKGLDWRPVPEEPPYNRDYQVNELRPTDDGLEWVTSLRPADEVKAALVGRIKAEAGARILAIVPDWKQRNLLAEANLLLAKGKAAWSADDTAAWEAGEAIWRRVKAIRDASNAAEAAVAAGADAKEAWAAFEAIDWPT